jgi:hypothetical protein
MGVTGISVGVAVGDASIVGGGGEAAQAVNRKINRVSLIIFFIVIAP